MAEVGNNGPQEGPTLQETIADKNRRLKGLRRRLEEKDREIESLRARLDGDRAAGLPELSARDAPVFFVVGRAKSGTSWLMRLLNAHPEILCKGEGRFFGREFIREDFKGPDQGRIQPSSLYRALLEADYLEAWIRRSVWTRGEDVEEHVNNLTRLATNYFLTRRLSRSGKKIVGDKTPFVSSDILRETGEIFPEAKVIHIIRDGRDGAVSAKHHRWNQAKDKGGVYDLRPDELEKREAFRKGAGRPAVESMFVENEIRNMAASWKEQISRSRNDGRTFLGANYAEVKYEDLLLRPEEETRRLLGFLGAEAGAKTIKRCVEAASFEKWTEGRERGREDPSSFFRKGVAGDWKNVFTERDKRAFKEAAGDLLIELGYEKDYGW